MAVHQHQFYLEKKVGFWDLEARSVLKALNFFHLCFFAEGKKSKYRWFKVEGFGGGGGGR